MRHHADVAWEWTGPVGTTVVGLAGITATYLSGRRQVTSARAVAQDQANAALTAQREDRHQRRIEAAYPILLDCISEGTAWLWQVEAFTLGGTDDRKPPAEPAAISGLTHRSPLTAVWSPRVARLTEQWVRASVAAIFNARRMGYLWEEADKQPPRSQVSDDPITLTDVIDGRASMVDQLHQRFKTHFAAASTAAAQIRQQVWRELRGEDSGYLPE